MKTGLFSVIALIAPISTAFADSYDVSGTGHGTSNAEVMAVSDDLVVVHAFTQYDGFESENADNPMASLTGPCFGSVLVDKGEVSGGGNCHYTDRGGEVAVIQWTAQAMAEDGKTQGVWEVQGGTGKWMEASGGGTFNAGTNAEGVYSNEVTGEVMLP